MLNSREKKWDLFPIKFRGFFRSSSSCFCQRWDEQKSRDSQSIGRGKPVQTSPDPRLDWEIRKEPGIASGMGFSMDLGAALLFPRFLLEKELPGREFPGNCGSLGMLDGAGIGGKGPWNGISIPNYSLGWVGWDFRDKSWIQVIPWIPRPWDSGNVPGIGFLGIFGIFRDL